MEDLVALQEYCEKKTVSHYLEFEAKKHDGWMPLHMAAHAGKIDNMKMLLDHGADIDGKATSGKTPLYTACEHAQEKSFDFLIEKGARLDISIIGGRTLMHAVCSDSAALRPLEASNIVQKLLDKQFALDMGDAYGFTPLHLAAVCSNPVILEMLLKKIKEQTKKKGSGDSATESSNSESSGIPASVVPAPAS